MLHQIQSTVSRQIKKGQTWSSATVSSVLSIFSKSSGVADQTCSPVSWLSALIENETRSTWEVQTKNVMIYYDWINVHSISTHCIWTSTLTRSPFHSPEVRRTALLGGRPFYTLHSDWGMTKERMQPHSPQLCMMKNIAALFNTKIPKYTIHGSKEVCRIELKEHVEI